MPLFGERQADAINELLQKDSHTWSMGDPHRPFARNQSSAVRVMEGLARKGTVIESMDGSGWRTWTLRKFHPETAIRDALKGLQNSPPLNKNMAARARQELAEAVELYHHDAPPALVAEAREWVETADRMLTVHDID